MVAVETSSVASSMWGRENAPMAQWRDRDRWRGLRDGSQCPICRDGRPLGVLAESPTTWVASWERVTSRGYACIIAKRHVVEPYELDAAERAAFFSDAVEVARAVEGLFRPVKLNYEIHGNTLPHLHLNLFPRYVGDPFEGGPIRGGEPHASHTPDDLDRMAAAFTIALRASGAHP